MTASELAEKLRALCGDPSCVTPSCLEIRAAADMLLAQGDAIAAQCAEIERLRKAADAARELLAAYEANVSGETEEEYAAWSLRRRESRNALHTLLAVEHLRADHGRAEAHADSRGNILRYLQHVLAVGEDGDLQIAVDRLIAERDDLRARIASADGPAVILCDATNPETKPTPPACGAAPVAKKDGNG